MAWWGYLILIGWPVASIVVGLVIGRIAKAADRADRPVPPGPESNGRRGPLGG